MKEQKLLLSAALIAFAAFFVSCKKSNTHSVQCRLASIYGNDSSAKILFNYNSDKKLSALIYKPSNYQTLFTYSGNLLFEKGIDSSGTIYRTDTIVLTPSGLISTHAEHHMIGGYYFYDTMTYDSYDHIIRGVTRSQTDVAADTYIWSNGDVISAYSGSHSVSYTYYTDKKIADGDYTKIEEILSFGAHYVSCAHLLRSAGDRNISYSYDADGKITSMTMKLDTNIEVYNYTYTCD